MSTHHVQRPSRVLISGAAGGLGSAVARRFAADGAHVALTDINADGLARLAKEIDGLALPADGTDRAALHLVVERTVEGFGGLDAVVAAQFVRAVHPFGVAHAGVADPC